MEWDLRILIIVSIGGPMPNLDPNGAFLKAIQENVDGKILSGVGKATIGIVAGQSVDSLTHSTAFHQSASNVSKSFVGKDEAETVGSVMLATGAIAVASLVGIVALPILAGKALFDWMSD
jgi:hypothetical protein